MSCWVGEGQLVPCAAAGSHAIPWLSAATRAWHPPPAAGQRAAAGAPAPPGDSQLLVPTGKVAWLRQMVLPWPVDAAICSTTLPVVPAGIDRGIVSELTALLA
jgi:hypothetical protein